MFLPRFKRSDIWYTLVLVGIGAACTGFAAAWLSINVFLQQLNTVPPDMFMFYVAAPLSALLVGPYFWWRLLIKVDRLSLKRGIFAGVLASVIAHPLTWFFAMPFTYLAGMRTIAYGSILDNPLTNPLELFGGSLVYALFSLLLVGWITTLVGAAGGGLIAFLQTRCHCRQRWQAALSLQP
jgi:hypothetical protein